MASEISSSTKGGAFLDSCSNIQVRERSCSGRRGSLKWGGCSCSESRLLLASWNLGNCIFTAGVKSVLRRHESDAGSVRPLEGRRERARCMSEAKLTPIRTIPSPFSSSLSCVTKGAGRRLRLRSYSPASMLSSNAAIRFLTLVQRIEGETGAHRWHERPSRSPQFCHSLN